MPLKPNGDLQFKFQSLTLNWNHLLGVFFDLLREMG